MPDEIILTQRTRHGPLERIMLTAPDPFKPPAQSVYRIDSDRSFARVSENEYAFQNFVRSVLAPVRRLPAERLPSRP